MTRFARSRFAAASCARYKKHTSKHSAVLGLTIVSSTDFTQKTRCQGRLAVPSEMSPLRDRGRALSVTQHLFTGPVVSARPSLARVSGSCGDNNGSHAKQFYVWSHYEVLVEPTGTEYCSLPHFP